jgi:hypothetical protein
MDGFVNAYDLTVLQTCMSGAAPLAPTGNAGKERPPVTSCYPSRCGLVVTCIDPVT